MSNTEKGKIYKTALVRLEPKAYFKTLRLIDIFERRIEDYEELALARFEVRDSCAIFDTSINFSGREIKAILDIIDRSTYGHPYKRYTPKE